MECARINRLGAGGGRVRGAGIAAGQPPANDQAGSGILRDSRFSDGTSGHARDGTRRQRGPWAWAASQRNPRGAAAYRE
jgi:hypothetical protein